MAKKSSSSAAAAKKTSTPKATVPVISETPVRNSSVPPKAVMASAAAPVKKAPTHDELRLAAYFMWRSNGGSEMENWLSAERKLNSL